MPGTGGDGHMGNGMRLCYSMELIGGYNVNVTTVHSDSGKIGQQDATAMKSGFVVRFNGMDRDAYDTSCLVLGEEITDAHFYMINTALIFKRLNHNSKGSPSGFIVPDEKVRMKLQECDCDGKMNVYASRQEMERYFPGKTPAGEADALSADSWPFEGSA